MRICTTSILIVLFFYASCSGPDRTISNDVLVNNQCDLALVILNGKDLSSEMMNKSMTFLNDGLLGMPNLTDSFGKKRQRYAYWNHHTDGNYEYITIEDKAYGAFTGKYRVSMIVHEGSPLEFVLLESNNDTLLLKVNRLVPL
jgi:hypothetical protein